MTSYAIAQEFADTLQDLNTIALFGFCGNLIEARMGIKGELAKFGRQLWCDRFLDAGGLGPAGSYALLQRRP